jgi:membrane protein
MSKSNGVLDFLRQVIAAYTEDQIPRQAAALAYFTIFALAPLLIVLIEVAALVLGGNGHHAQARDAIIAAMASHTGKQSAAAVGSIVQATFDQSHRQGLVAGIVSWIVLIAAATGLFGSIQEALDDIWRVERQKRPWYAMFKERAVAFGLIAGVAFVLLVSLAVNMAVAALTKALAGGIPGMAAILSIADFVVSFAVIAALFAAIFKVLPHVAIRWKDAAFGGAAAAVLFMIGQILLSWYLGRAGTASAFGAAGSLVVLVLWIYYSGQIFLLGAEFTKIHARHPEPIEGPPSREPVEVPSSP